MQHRRKITFLDWESRHYCSRKETQKIQDFLLLLHGICRINYAEERDWLDAIEKGYTDTDKNGIKEKAVRFLRSHPFIGMLTKNSTASILQTWKLQKNSTAVFAEKYIL